MRIPQWYKNLLVFVPIFFAGEIFNLSFILQSLIGFVSLCLVSSSSYIINDILDRKKDKQNPEKKNRPIASGKILIQSALIFSIILFLSGILIALNTDYRFIILLLVLFSISQAYSLFLKNEAIVDVVLVSINFILRAVSGAVIINVEISKWLIVGIFFLALFLAISKRASEIKLLGSKNNHRKVYRHYTKDMIHAMLIMSKTMLLISYLLFSLFSSHDLLFLSIPIAIYPLFRFFYLIESGSRGYIAIGIDKKSKS
jgi:4-hydroxybenzoate polyprenyltransferase